MADVPEPQRRTGAWLRAIAGFRWELAPLAILISDSWSNPRLWVRWMGSDAAVYLDAGITLAAVAGLLAGYRRARRGAGPVTRAIWLIALLMIVPSIYWAVTYAGGRAITGGAWYPISVPWVATALTLFKVFGVGWIASKVSPFGPRVGLFAVAAFVSVEVAVFRVGWDLLGISVVHPALRDWFVVFSMVSQAGTALAVALVASRFRLWGEGTQTKALVVLAAISLVIGVARGAVFTVGQFAYGPAWRIWTDDWLPIWPVHLLDAVGLALLAVGVWGALSVWRRNAGRQDAIDRPDRDGSLS